ncbi:MAG: hypothetical protein ABWY07_13500 [Burkholderiales bacterium]
MSANSIAIAADSTTQAASSTLLAIEQSRASIVEGIVNTWRREVGGSELQVQQLRDALMGLRADKLLAARLAGTAQGVEQILLNENTDGAPNARNGVAHKALGDAANDLVFTPLTPCRLVDTRGNGAPIQGGTFAPNTRRTITPAGACGIPTSSVVALQLSFHTQNLTSGNGGYISMMAPGDPVSGLVDVFNLGAEWSASNAAVQTSGNGAFDVFVAQSNPHLIIDVMGYFAAPAATPLDCVTTTNTNNNTSYPPGASDQLAVACTTGYQVTGGGCTFTNADGSNATDKTVFLNRSTRRFDTNTGLFVNEWICQWTNADAVKSFRFIARAVCCRVPGR